MKTFLLTIIVLLSTSAFSQVQIQWQRSFGGSENEYAYTVEQTADGGFITVGSTCSTDGDVTGYHIGASWDISDYWVVKTNPAGLIEWQKCFGGFDNDVANVVVQTTDGGYLVAGITYSNDGDVTAYYGEGDIWILKLDNSGNIEWEKNYGGTGVDACQSIIKANDGGYILVGSTSSYSMDVDGNHGGTDAWVFKINDSGEIVWQKCYGGNNTDGVRGISLTNDGNYLIAGGSISLDGDLTENHGDADVWILKISTTGSIIWQKSLGGTEYDGACSVIETTDNGYIVSGSSYSSDGDASINHGGSDIWVVKLDESRNIVWEKSLGDTAFEWSGTILKTIDGGYILSVSTNSLTGDIQGNHGDRDIWIIKLTDDGEMMWQKCLGGTDFDYAYTMIRTNDGGYIFASRSSSNNYDVTNNHSSLSNSDLWLVKLVEPNITGIVYNDENSNGILDPGEAGVAGSLVKLEPGPVYSITNNEGNFIFYSIPDDYTISNILFPNWESTSAPEISFTVDSIGQEIDNISFGVKAMNAVEDVAIHINGTLVRVSNQPHFWIFYKNIGTTTASGSIQFEFESFFTYLNSTVLPDSQTDSVLIFNYEPLGPGAERSIVIDFQSPGTEHIFDSFIMSAFITPLISDIDTTNNYDTLPDMVNGPYDPNYKTVVPVGYNEEGYVLHDQRLSYTINFQNVGNDTAFNIIIRDTLDADLDIETFLIDASSHNVELELLGGNEMLFRFNNILLPDSTTNEFESHGFIRYSISPKPDLPDYTEVNNTAYIFFDSNPAIITNTVLNTFISNIPVTVPYSEKQTINVTVYPNPTTGSIMINLPDGSEKIEIYDGNQKMQRSFVPAKNSVEISTNGMSAGMYYVKVFTSKGTITTCFIKQ